MFTDLKNGKKCAFLKIKKICKRGIENYYLQQYVLDNLMCVCKDNWHIKYPCQKTPFLRPVQENRSQTLLKEASLSFGEFQ